MRNKLSLTYLVLTLVVNQLYLASSILLDEDSISSNNETTSSDSFLLNNSNLTDDTQTFNMSDLQLNFVTESLVNIEDQFGSELLASESSTPGLEHLVQVAEELPRTFNQSDSVTDSYLESVVDNSTESNSSAILDSDPVESQDLITDYAESVVETKNDSLVDLDVIDLLPGVTTQNNYSETTELFIELKEVDDAGGVDLEKEDTEASEKEDTEALDKEDTEALDKEDKEASENEDKEALEKEYNLDENSDSKEESDEDDENDDEKEVKDDENDNTFRTHTDKNLNVDPKFNSTFKLIPKEIRLKADCPDITCEFGYQTDLNGKTLCTCHNPCENNKCGNKICIIKMLNDKFQGLCVDPKTIERPFKCHLPVLKGTCRNYESRFYYNSFHRSCEHFVFRGCNGNENNFHSWHECNTECNVCGQQPERGPCRGHQIRYYYDQGSQSCFAFGYGGCQGNRNKFDTLKQCQATCKP